MQLNIVLALFLVAVIICALVPQEVAAKPKDQAGKKKKQEESMDPCNSYHEVELRRLLQYVLYIIYYIYLILYYIYYIILEICSI